MESARKFALQNAVLHGGKADPKAVLGKMLAEDPSLRARAQEAAALVERVVADVNELGLDTQRAELAAVAPPLLEKNRHDRRPEKHPPLPDAAPGEEVLRLAPHPRRP